MQRNQVKKRKGSTGRTVLYSVAITTDVPVYSLYDGAAQDKLLHPPPDGKSRCTKLGDVCGRCGDVAPANPCPPVQIEVGYL